MDPDPIDASLLILAGGRSGRMGQSKPHLQVGGGSLLAWILARLAPSFGQVMVSRPDPGWAPPDDVRGVELVDDIHPGRGPLAGIQAGLLASRFEAMFVAACDMPAVTVELARALEEAGRGHAAAVPLHGDRLEPVCAVYRKSAAAALGIALAEGRLEARAALAGLDVIEVAGLEDGLFLNLNTPEDYRRFLAGTS